MNHLEQLVGEWLHFNGYFVRTSVPVGPRKQGGFEGELDVLGLHLQRKHLLHVECSLDALSDEKRQARFLLKFDRGARYARDVFAGAPMEDVTLEHIAVLQFASGRVESYGGARLVTVRELIREIEAGLGATSPSSGAVGSGLPLLRTLQLSAWARKSQPRQGVRLVPP